MKVIEFILLRQYVARLLLALLVIIITGLFCSYSLFPSSVKAEVETAGPQFYIQGKIPYNLTNGTNINCSVVNSKIKSKKSKTGQYKVILNCQARDTIPTTTILETLYPSYP